MAAMQVRQQLVHRSVQGLVGGVEHQRRLQRLFVGC